MKIPSAHMFPASSGSLQSLEELLAAALAENERQAKLLEELRQENAALNQDSERQKDFYIPTPESLGLPGRRKKAVSAHVRRIMTFTI